MIRIKATWGTVLRQGRYFYKTQRIQNKRKEIEREMDPLTARIILVIALVGALECSYVYFTRRCYFFQISHGIRKEPWQKDAIHYCYQFITDDTSSKYIPIENGVNCETAGKDYFLQGGTEFFNGTHITRAAYCAMKKEYRLVNCSMPETKFSYMKGFDIMYYLRVLRKIVSTPTEDDYTAFRIELCDLEKRVTGGQ